jgi:molecular chaperone DnaK
MVKEAEAHAEEDKRRKELVEARNQADATIYTAEKSVKDSEGHAPANQRTEVEQAVAAAKDAMTGDDVRRILQTTAQLAQAAQRLGQATQQQAEADSQAHESPPTAGPDVVDAEFEEVDDKGNRKAS